MMNRLPELQAASLTGETYQLPADLRGDLNVVLVVYEQWQQPDADTWLPMLDALAKQYPVLHYYELPTMERFHPMQQRMIDLMMISGIPDRAARARTMTLYLDRGTFNASIGVRGTEAIQVLLVNRAGDILWQAAGRVSPDKVHDLENTLARLANNGSDAPLSFV